MRKLASVSIVVLAMCAAAAQAQDQEPAQAQEPQVAPRRILVAVEKSVYSPFTDDEISLLKQSFLTVLSEADGAPSPLDYGTRAFPGSPDARSKAARDAGADCWLLIRFEGLRSRPRFIVTAHDLLYGTTPLEVTVRRSEPFPLMDVYRERWDEIVPLVAKAFPPVGRELYSQGPPAAVPLKIHALPGTLISGLSSGPVTVGKDGSVSVNLPAPAPYTLRATLGGYVPSVASFYFDGQNEITVTQTRSPWLMFDLAFLDGLYPGVSATVATSPFPAFLRVGYTSFRIGLALNQDGLFSSLPLSQVTALAGIYLSPEDRLARWYVGAGPLLRITLPPGGTLTIDNLLPWGIQAVAGLQLSLGGKLHYVLELAPTLYSTPQPALFYYSFGTDKGTFPFLRFPPDWALEVLEVRMGLRLVL